MKKLLMFSAIVTPFRHSRAGGNPALPSHWIPACAGMTTLYSCRQFRNVNNALALKEKQ